MADSTPTRILIADDHPIVRSGLRGLIDAQGDMSVVGEAESAGRAAELAAGQQADVAVLDLTMPGGGVAGIRGVRAAAPSCKILVLTMHDDAASVRDAFSAGADGYLVKRTPGEHLIDAIRTILSNQRFIDPSLDEALGSEEEEERASLSRRERQVLELVARGHTNKEVATVLDVSVKSVETYRSRVLEKLQLKSRAELVKYAIDIGLLDPTRPEDMAR